MYTFEMVKMVELETGFKSDFLKEHFAKIFFSELESLKEQNKHIGRKNNSKRDEKIVLERIIDWIKHFDYEYLNRSVKDLSYFLAAHRFAYALLTIHLYERGWKKPE